MLIIGGGWGDPLAEARPRRLESFSPHSAGRCPMDREKTLDARGTERQFSRRGFLTTAALGVAAYSSARGAFADELTRTPKQTEGPFYPDKLPLDTDNDLLVIN